MSIPKTKIEGKYIVIEGVDGSGKSYITDVLNANGIKTIKEPSDSTNLQKSLRTEALTNETLDTYTRFILMLTNRALAWQSISRKGNIVSDRSYISSLTYHVADILYAQNDTVDEAIIKELTDKALAVTSFVKGIPLHIDKLYLLNPTADLLVERHNDREDTDVIEDQGMKYFELVKLVYLTVVDYLYTLGYIKEYEILKMSNETYENFSNCIVENILKT